MSGVYCRWTLALLACLHAYSASAASPDTVNDARCFFAAISLIRSGDKATQAAATSSAMYYLGRLDGREPGLDLEALILDVARRFSPSEIFSESQRCGHQLSARGQVVSAIGAKLAQSSR
jgi:hypothetical protein